MAERAELYVLGDSISMHYGPYLKRFLEPAVGYSRKGEGLAAGDLNLVSDANGGDSRSCLEFLETNLPLLAERFDWLLWNCGLHDIKTTAAGRQVSPECGIHGAKVEDLPPGMETGGQAVVGVFDLGVG